MNVSLDLLPQMAFLLLLVFGRVGTMLMLAPALGEQTIPANLRLGFALIFSLVVFPLVSERMPPMPSSIPAMGIMLIREILVGLVLGGIARMIVMATQTAGAIIAFQSGLSAATANDPSQPGVQGAMIGNFLTLVAITLVFVTDLHYLVLAAILDSYTYFPPTGSIMLEDAMIAALAAFSGAFIVGVQMSAPFLVFGLVFNLGLGLMARLMMQLQVYFIAMPANVGIGFLLLMVLLSSMMMWYLSHFERFFIMFAS